MKTTSKSFSTLQSNISTKLETIKPLLGQHKEIEKIISAGNPEPSIAKLKKELGEGIAKVLLLEKIAYLTEIIGTEINQIQVNYIIDYIFDNYWGYKLSDFNIITKMLASRKSYGKPTIQSILSTIDEYSYLREEASVKYQIKKSNERKYELAAEEKILAFYEKLKSEAKKPIKSQKEIDKENKRKNEEKIKELKKLYEDKF